MSMIDLVPSDATFICRDDPAADHSRACALVTAAAGRRGITSAILLKFPRPSLAANTVVTQAELVLHPWQSRGAEIHPAFYVYSLETDFCGCLATWQRQPKFGGFPQASQPAATCAKDGALHCDITNLAMDWLSSKESHMGIAIAPQADTCLMLHSACSAHPPCLRLHCCGNLLQEPPEEERRGQQCGPDSEEDRPRQALCGYREKVYLLDICNATACTKAMDISQARTVTFLIKNCGCTAIGAKLQISPDGQDWMDDRQGVAVSPEGLAAITPYLFARYIRLNISSADPKGGKAKVWYQSQSLNYRLE